MCFWLSGDQSVLRHDPTGTPETSHYTRDQKLAITYRNLVWFLIRAMLLQNDHRKSKTRVQSFCDITAKSHYFRACWGTARWPVAPATLRVHSRNIEHICLIYAQCMYLKWYILDRTKYESFSLYFATKTTLFSKLNSNNCVLLFLETPELFRTEIHGKKPS